MARPTLKLSKPATPATTSRPPTSRAIRAMRGKRGSGAMPLPSPTPATAPPKEPADSRTSPTTRRRTRAKSGAAPPAARDGRRGSSAADAAARASKPSVRPASNPAERHENPDDPRLSKRMSELGLCSRREADEWIENGWVQGRRQGGRHARACACRATRSIEIDRAASRHQSEQVTILLNKPIGYVSGQAEDGHQPAIGADHAGEPLGRGSVADARSSPRHLRGLAPAGRLDIDSTGLLVFTQDGRVAKRLIGQRLGGREGIPRARRGHARRGGHEAAAARPRARRREAEARAVSWQNEDQLRFVLREGRKRQIRRMCELVGLVGRSGLKRVRSGSVPLGPLPVGQWRYLRRDEKF